MKFEVEDGTTMDGRPVRFGYNPLEFESFSWRGYAQMSLIQVSHTHTLMRLNVLKLEIMFFKMIVNGK